MPTELAKRLLDQAAMIGVKSVRYHGVGESLLHPEIASIVRHGSSLGLNHSLSTNCYALAGEVGRSLAAESSLHLILAIPWVMPQKFVDRCVRNALDLLTAGPLSHNLHVLIVCAAGSESHYTTFADTFLPYAERMANVWLHIKQPLTWPSDDMPNVGFVPDDLLGHSKVIVGRIRTPVSIGAGRSMPDRFLMILADGTCVPCCVGIKNWGLPNANDRPLSEVWGSPRMQEIRRLWRQADHSILCGKCKTRTDCLQVEIV